MPAGREPRGRLWPAAPSVCPQRARVHTPPRCGKSHRQGSKPLTGSGPGSNGLPLPSLPQAPSPPHQSPALGATTVAWMAVIAASRQAPSVGPLPPHHHGACLPSTFGKPHSVPAKRRPRACKAPRLGTRPREAAGHPPSELGQLQGWCEKETSYCAKQRAKAWAFACFCSFVCTSHQRPPLCLLWSPRETMASPARMPGPCLDSPAPTVPANSSTHASGPD